MATPATTAEVNIHLRAKARDRDLIDQAAELVGANRSQFMLASAIEKAKNVLLDQTTLSVDARIFQKILAWMDEAPSQAEIEGMHRVLAANPPWSRD